MLAMMLNCRPLWHCLLVILLCRGLARIAAAHASHKHHSRRALERESVEHLVNNGYYFSIHEAYWAADQGPDIIPVLADMLPRHDEYFNRFGTTAAFPFNAIWALGEMKNPRALRVLKHYYARTHDRDAAEAIQAFELRRRHSFSWRYGVLSDDKELSSGPSQKSPIVAHLKEGEPIKALKDHIENRKELDARNGYALYDYVRSLRTGRTGYIVRASDDFVPWM
jgi:hypothetical protein